MCEHTECKFIIIKDGIKIVVHYNFEPVLIQFWDISKNYYKNFYPKSKEFVAKNLFNLEEIKNEYFDLTDILDLEL